MPSEFATIFFAVLLSIKKEWHELMTTSAYRDILLTTFIIGILCYIFSFFGLQHTSAGNASIITLTEIFFSFLFFHVLRKDYIPVQHTIGAVLVVCGAIIVLYPNIHSLQIGDLFILLAAFIAPLGNFFTQRARKKVSSETIMFIRSIITTLFILLLILIFRIDFSFSDLESSSLLLLINGIFLLGLSKIMWIEGIHRISVTKAGALGSMAPLLTLFYAWLLLKDIPTVWQLFSLIPMAFGVILLSRQSLTRN